MGLLTEREELELLELEAKESQQQAPSTASIGGDGRQQSPQQGPRARNCPRHGNLAQPI